MTNVIPQSLQFFEITLSHFDRREKSHPKKQR